LGDSKGIRNVKTAASKPLGLAVNVSGWGLGYSPRYPWATPPASFTKKGVISFSLSCEDAQNKNDC